MSTLRTNAIQTTGGKPLLGSSGSIIQVVSVNKTDEYYLASTGTPTSVPGLSATIIPTSSSSKILILGHCNMSATSNGGDSYARLVRNTTLGIGSGAAGYFAQVAGQDYFAVHSRVIYFVDSPATTAATTYTIQVWGQNVYVNSRGLNGDFDTSSQIVLMEIT